MTTLDVPVPAASDPPSQEGTLKSISKNSDELQLESNDTGLDHDKNAAIWNEKPQSTSKIVEWNGPDDPENPQNWSSTKKILITVLATVCTFVVSFASSALSPGERVLAKEYNVSAVVTDLSITVYVLGFASGPLAWAPASECIGRYWPFMLGYIGFMSFTVGVATAQNFYTILICRFFMGACGIASVAVTPGVIVDLWGPRTRPLITMTWTAFVTIGPSVGPIVGSFTVMNTNLGWRWTMWFTLIISAVFFIGLAILYTETCAPFLLQRKAHKLRLETKDWALHAKRDEEPTQPKELARKYGLKPVVMLFTEPILLVVTLYNCFVYGVVYLTFEAFPYTFGTVRGWDLGISSLPFLSLLVGFVVGYFLQAWWHLRTADKKIAAGLRPSPEDQLPPMIAGSVFLIIGFFWFAWTSSPSTSWVAQIFSGPFIGAGIILVFTPCVTYLIECYVEHATSALAANAIARGAAAAAFPLFATQMYEALGVDWATSLLGFLTLAFTPAPIVFYLFGKKIRGWSKFAVGSD